MNKPTYHFSADLIRAVAIIGVVIIHVLSEFVNFPKFFLTFPWWFANIVDSGARVSVPLFVMLSGFLLLHHEKNEGLKEFLKKRFSKIGVPLLVWPLIYLLWNLYIHQGIFVFKLFLTDFISLNIYYHLYYLYVIAGLYLLTPPLKIFLNHSHQKIKQYLLFLCFLFSITATLTKYFLPVDINLGSIFTICFPFLSYYLAGDFVRNMVITKKQFWIMLVNYMGLTFLTALGDMWYMLSVHWSTKTSLSNANYDRYFYDYLSITVSIMSVIVFILLLNLPRLFPSAENPFFAKIIRQFSITSFGIYLLHPLILDITNRYISFNLEQTPFPLWLVLILKTFLLLIVSYTIIKVIQKIPVLKFLVT